MKRILEWWDDLDLRRIFGIYRLRSGLRRVKRFYKWFPVIWHDEDWDAHYALKILRFKLQQIYANIEKDNRHTDVQNTLKDMRIMDELLKRVIENDYLCDCTKSEFCSCKVDNFIRWVDGVYTSPFCNWCNKYGIKREHAIEEYTWQYAMDHFKKKSRKWWC